MTVHEGFDYEKPLKCSQ